MNDIEFRTGVIRPLECFKEGWELIKPNYWLIFGITALAMIGWALLRSAPFQRSSSNSRDNRGGIMMLGLGLYLLGMGGAFFGRGTDEYGIHGVHQ